MDVSGGCAVAKKQTVDIQKLKHHKAEHHGTSKSKAHIKNSPESFLTLLKRSKFKSLLYTNHKDKNKKTEKLYYVRITKEMVDYREAYHGEKKHIIYAFKDKSITVNKSPGDSVFLATFRKKLNQVSKDIQDGKAVAFSEPEKGD
jgi:hypothetical protein